MILFVIVHHAGGVTDVYQSKNMTILNGAFILALRILAICSMSVHLMVQPIAPTIACREESHV